MGICLSLLAVMSLKYLSNQTKSPATSASKEANSEDLYMSMSSQVKRKSRTRQKKKVSIICSKTYLKWPLSKRSEIGFQKQLLLHAGQKYCRMGSTLSYYLSLRSLFCLFQWPFYCNSLHIAAHMIYYLGLDVRKPDIVVCKQQRCRLA